MDNENPKILIVEDDAITAQRLRSSLEQMGYEVVGIAASGEEALEAAIAGRPDVTLMDIRLRGDMSGIQAAKQIQLQMDSPIIYLTAYTEESILQESASTQPYGFLVKPVRERELRAGIEIALYRVEVDRQLKNLNQMLRSVREVNQLIAREKDRFALLERACQILYQVRDNCLVWIRLEDVSEERTVPLAGTREAAAFEKAIRGYCGEFPCQCPHHKALRERRAVIIQDIAIEGSFDLWREKALACGHETGFEFRSGGWVPLLYGEQCFGVLCVLSVKPNVFTAEETELLQELASDLGVALHSIELGAEKERVERELRASEEKYRTLVEKSGASVATIDIEGKLVFVNDVFCQLVGYSPEELRGIHFLKLLHPDDLEGLLELFSQTAKNPGARPILEFRLVHKDGRPIWCYTRSTPLFVQDQMTGFNAIIQDITERKQAEEALKESEERFRSLIELSPDAIFINRGNKMAYINPVGLALFGASSPEQVLGKSIFDFIHPDWHEVVRGRIRQELETGLSVPPLEEKYLRLDGTLIDVEVSAGPILLGGEPATQVIVRDITERKRAEEAFRESEERYRVLFEGSTQGILATDMETGRFVFANPSICRMLGYSASELLQLGLADIHPQDALEQIKSGMETQSLEGASQLFGIPCQRKDGSLFYADINGSYTTFHGRKCLVGFFSDITERKQAEQALVQANQQLRALTSYWQTALEAERTYIAREIHDEFGQAMTALKMDLSWLAKRLPRGSELVDRINSMTGQVDSTINLIRRTASELRPQMLDDLGLNAALEWQAQNFSKHYSIACQLDLPPEDLGLELALSTSLFRIFQEALTNVARHAQATHVTVKLQQTAQTLMLSIQDDGRGITESEYKNRHSLGLLGMRERALQWGGEFMINSEAGKGTSVSVLIPLPARSVTGGDR